MAGPFLVARNRVLIDAPAQRVFDYLADLSRVIEWSGEPNFSITSVPQGPPQTGSHIRWEKSGVMQGPVILRGGMGDSRVTLVKVTRIAEYQPNNALEIETRNSYNGLLHSIEKFTFDFLEEEGRTRVTMVAEVEAMVPSLFMGPVYAIRFVRGVADRLLGRRIATLFPGMQVGRHLAFIKQRTETPEIASTY